MTLEDFLGFWTFYGHYLVTYEKASVKLFLISCVGLS
jgi:hypothetical protein